MKQHFYSLLFGKNKAVERSGRKNNLDGMLRGEEDDGGGHVHPYVHLD